MPGKMSDDGSFGDLIQNEGGKIINQKSSQSPRRSKDYEQISIEHLNYGKGMLLWKD